MVSWLLAGGAAAEGPKEEDLTKLPGYVDFAKLGLFDDDEAVVEIYLHDVLLHMVAQLSAFADPELTNVLEKLKLVRVQKFLLEDRDVDSVQTGVADMAAKLEQDAWVRAVRVREDTEHIYVYFKLGEKTLDGITIMAVEEGLHAAFVNIVGEIDPEEIGRLGRKFNIDELDKYDWNWDEIEDRKREERRKR
jgi:hypothetical protein